MGKCKSGPWCLKCEKAVEITNKKIFDDYTSVLPPHSCYTLFTPSGVFASGYVCKKAIKRFKKGY